MMSIVEPLEIALWHEPMGVGGHLVNSECQTFRPR
jgi:hypothetical protein